MIAAPVSADGVLTSASVTSSIRLRWVWTLWARSSAPVQEARVARDSVSARPTADRAEARATALRPPKVPMS